MFLRKVLRKVYDRNICVKHFSRTSFFEGNCIRHVNPLYENRDGVVENLYESLTKKLPERYSFLDVKALDVTENKDVLELKESQEILDLVQHLQNGTKTEECLSTLETWMTKNKFRFVFYLLSNKDDFFSEVFLKKVILNLSGSLDTLHPQEYVALWLCIYFSTEKSWSKEELFEFLDFNECQIKFARLLAQNQLSISEICCILYGFRKIENVELFHPELRSQLHDFFADKIGSLKGDRNLLISLSLPILKKTPRENSDVVSKCLLNLSKIKTELSLPTLCHIVSYGMVFADGTNFINYKDEIVKRLISHENELSSLSLTDMKRTLKFLSRVSDTADGKFF